MGRWMRSDCLIPMVLVGTGLLIVSNSSSYVIGTMSKPEAGFWPLVMGMLLILLSLADLWQVLKNSKSLDTGFALTRQQWIKFISVCLCLAGWVLLSSVFGWLIMTFIISFLLSKVFGLKGLLVPILLSLAIVLFNYLLFDVWFYLDLPTGMFAWINLLAKG